MSTLLSSQGQGNTNQIWEFYSVPGFETRVVVKNTATKYVLYANGKYCSISDRLIKC